MGRQDLMVTIDIQNGEFVPGSEETTKWVSQVEQRFSSDDYKKRKSSANVCIFKVPRSIRDFGPKAYDAYVLPLGPFSYSQNKKDLSAVDDHKLRTVESTLQRLNVEGIESLINIVMKWDEQIRDYFQDRAVECSDKTLAWIMTMAACSIIQFFYPNPVAEQDVNLIFGLRQVDTLHDILKLENQIPLLVLKWIIKLYRDEKALTEFARGLSKFAAFRRYPFLESEEEIARKIMRYITNGDANHLLDLCRMLITDFLLGSPSNSSSASPSNSGYASVSASPPNSNYASASACRSNCSCASASVSPPNSSTSASAPPSNRRKMDESPSFLSAEKLSQAGIKFEKSDDGKIGFTRTRWGSVTLSLPPITVDDYTETFLRNLMALEECQKCVRPADTRISVEDSTETFLRNLTALEECQMSVRRSSPIRRRSPRIISYYICSLDELINSKEDVALLTEGNIIENLLGSDQEVADMFNALCNGITVEKYRPYDEIKRSVKEHHHSSKYRWIAEIKQRYFSKPWLLPPLAVGGLVSVLTLVQMVTTLFQSSSI